MLLPIILLIIGLGLVVAEVFIVSMGLISLIAGTVIIMADVLAFGVSTAAGWTLVGAEILLIPFLIWGAFRLLPHTPFGKRMVLLGPATRPGHGVPSLDGMVGRTGEAVTNLRPAGTVRFGDERLSVVATGRWVAKGEAVRVVQVEGTEVRVRPVEPAEIGSDDEES